MRPQSEREPESQTRQQPDSAPTQQTVALVPETPPRTGSSPLGSGGWRAVSPTQHSPNAIAIEAASDADFVELSAFLAHHGLMRWRPLFIEHEITFGALLHFEERDLMELGLARGPQVTIIRTMKRWRHIDSHSQTNTAVGAADGTQGSPPSSAPVGSDSRLPPASPMPAEKSVLNESERVQAQAQAEAAELREQARTQYVTEAVRRQEETSEDRRYVQEKAQQYNASRRSGGRDYGLSSGSSSISLLSGPPTSAEIRALVVDSSRRSPQRVGLVASPFSEPAADNRWFPSPRRSSPSRLRLISPTRETAGDSTTRHVANSADQLVEHGATAPSTAGPQVRSTVSTKAYAGEPIAPRRGSPLRNRISPLRRKSSSPARSIATRSQVSVLSGLKAGAGGSSAGSRPINRSFAAAGGSHSGTSSRSVETTPRRIFGAGGSLAATTSAQKSTWGTPPARVSSLNSPGLGNLNAPGSRIAAMAANARATRTHAGGGARTSVRMRSPVRIGSSTSLGSMASVGSRSSTLRR